MNCVVPGRGIRAFGKAVQCLAKIGEDLHIEALEKGLSLRTVNSAHSAFVNFLFCRKFFSSYSDGLGSRPAGERGDEEEEEEDTIKCKITIKSVLSVFRSLSTLEKTVDYFSLSINCKLSKLVFIFHCRHGIVKTHQLGFQECDSLRAVYAKELSPNHIKLQSRVLGEVVGNFPTFLEEVTLLADPECVRLKNYCKEDSVDQRGTMTEVRLVPTEFDDYQIGVDTGITFCLKELRAVLLFTDALPQTVSLYFESGGSPVVFSIDDTADLQADFVLATLQDSPVDPTNSIANGNSTALSHSTSSTSAAGGIRGKKNAAYIQQRQPTRQNTRERRRGTANGRGLTRRQDGGGGGSVDEWNHPFSHSESRSTNREEEKEEATRAERLEAGEEERQASREESLHRAKRSQVYHSTPSRQRRADGSSGSSGLQRNTGESGEGVMMGEGGHVTGDSGDGAGGEGVMVGEGGHVTGDSGDGAGGEGVMVGEGGHVTGDGGEGVMEDEGWGEEADPLDALFGEENMMDVGDGGWEGGGEGGWGGDFGAEKEQSTTSHIEPQHTLPGNRISRSPYIATSHLTAGSSGVRASLRSQPHSHTSDPHTPPSPTPRGEEWGGEERSVTQDSILQDSGFLPGTPPAKKFKASSAVLGGGLLTCDLPTPREPGILAPDSEDDESS